MAHGWVTAKYDGKKIVVCGPGTAQRKSSSLQAEGYGMHASSNGIHNIGRRIYKQKGYINSQNI